MTDSDQGEMKETGVIVTLLDRLSEQRLPRLLRMEERVNDGERLTDEDLELLGEMLENWKQYGHVMADHKELRTLLTKVIDLYHSITKKALENERAGEG